MCMSIIILLQQKTCKTATNESQILHLMYIYKLVSSETVYSDNVHNTVQTTIITGFSPCISHRGNSYCLDISDGCRATKHSDVSREWRFQPRLALFPLQTLYQGLQSGERGITYNQSGYPTCTHIHSHMYSGTSPIRTPMGRRKLFMKYARMVYLGWERCPVYRGVISSGVSL